MNSFAELQAVRGLPSIFGNICAPGPVEPQFVEAFVEITF